MNIAITGATGLIGKKLCRELIKEGHILSIYSRDPEKAKDVLPEAAEYIKWDYEIKNLRIEIPEDIDAVIHLAGSNIFGKRWNEDYKKEIFESRILSTRNIVEALNRLNRKPKCFICSSAVGYYGDSGNAELDESAPAGVDFLAKVCKAWEEEAVRAASSGIRTVSIRTGIVLDRNGGAFAQMLVPFKLFIGGSMGSGKQWFPWIHIDDLVNIYLFALKEDSIHTAVNASSPNPVTMKVFAETLGKIMHRPSFFTVPAFLLRMAIGESSETISSSIKAIPSKLAGHNFKFKFENLEAALKDLIK